MVCWTISLFMDDLPIEMPWNALFLRRFSTKHVWFPEGTSGGSKRALESPFTPARGVHCFWRVCAGKGWLEGNPKASESVSWNLWWGRCCWLTRCGRRVRDGSPKISGSIYEKPCKTLDSFVSFFFFRMFSVCPLNHWKSSIFRTCWCGSGGFHSYLQDKPVRNSSLAKLFPVRNFSRALQRFRERNRWFLCVDWGA